TYLRSRPLDVCRRLSRRNPIRAIEVIEPSVVDSGARLDDTLCGVMGCEVVAAETRNAEDGRRQHQVSRRPAAVYDPRSVAPKMQLKLCPNSTKRWRCNQ